MNIEASFPDKTRSEQRQIERKFYLHLCRLIIEIPYGGLLSVRQMNRRVRFENWNQVRSAALQSGGAMLMTAHLGNWEWMANYSGLFIGDGIESANVYHRLHSRLADGLMLRIRHRRNCHLVERKQTLRFIVEQHRASRPTIYGMIADQKPTAKPLDCMFLGQQTPFITGTESIACRMNYPVFFVHVKRNGIGHYVCTFSLITDKPTQTQAGYITQEYARRLEANILEDPAIWLWSHNRWRRKTK